MLLSNSLQRVMVLPAECQGFNANYLRYFGNGDDKELVEESHRPLFLREPDKATLDSVAASRKWAAKLAKSGKKIKKPAKPTPTWQAAPPRRPNGRVSLIDMAARDKAAAERWMGPFVPAWTPQWGMVAGYPEMYDYTGMAGAAVEGEAEEAAPEKTESSEKTGPAEKTKAEKTGSLEETGPAEKTKAEKTGSLEETGPAEKTKAEKTESSEKTGSAEKTKAEKTGSLEETGSTEKTTAEKTGPEIVFCTRCGAKAQSTFKFCRACGAAMLSMDQFQ